MSLLPLQSYPQIALTYRDLRFLEGETEYTPTESELEFPDGELDDTPVISICPASMETTSKVEKVIVKNQKRTELQSLIQAQFCVYRKSFVEAATHLETVAQITSNETLKTKAIAFSNSLSTNETNSSFFATLVPIEVEILSSCTRVEDSDLYYFLRGLFAFTKENWDEASRFFNWGILSSKDQKLIPFFVVLNSFLIEKKEGPHAAKQYLDNNKPCFSDFEEMLSVVEEKFQRDILVEEGIRKGRELFGKKKFQEAITHFGKFRTPLQNERDYICANNTFISRWIANFEIFFSFPIDFPKTEGELVLYYNQKLNSFSRNRFKENYLIDEKFLCMPFSPCVHTLIGCLNISDATGFTASIAFDAALLSFKMHCSEQAWQDNDKESMLSIFSNNSVIAKEVVKKQGFSKLRIEFGVASYKTYLIVVPKLMLIGD